MHLLRCSYTKNGPRALLADEHIIPEGLNGAAVLPEASCQICERRINEAESHLLSTTLMPARAFLQMQSKRPGKRPKQFPIYDASQMPRRRVMVDAGDYPAALYLPVFPPPGALCLLPWRPFVMLPPFMYYLRDTVKEVCAKYGVGSVSPPMLGVHHLCRLVAKIAHGFGVAHFGLDNLDYLLRPLILGEPDQNVFWFIGNDPPEPPSESLHEVQVQVHRTTMLIVARVRLFAKYGAPAYRVIVGRPTASTPAL